MITCAARLTRMRDASMPRSVSIAISRSSVRGLTTTPLPMTGVMCGMQDAAGHEVELEHLVTDDHRVAGVVTALVADDERDRLGEQVGGLSLAFVAPLETDDDGSGHLRRSRQTKAPATDGWDLDTLRPCASPGGECEPAPSACRPHGTGDGAYGDRCPPLACQAIVRTGSSGRADDTSPAGTGRPGPQPMQRGPERPSGPG